MKQDGQHALQTAMVARARAILRFRAAERGAGEGVLEQAGIALATARQRLMAARGGAFDDVCEALALDDLDRDALCLIAAPHLEHAVRGEIAGLRADQRAHVDAALLVELLCRSAEDGVREARRFAEEGVLVTAGLIELVAPALGRQPSLLEHETVPTARLLGILAGAVALDRRLARIARIVPARADDADGVLPREDQDELVVMVRAALRPDAVAPRILVSDPGKAGDLRTASWLAHACGRRRMLVVDCALLPRSAGELTLLLVRLAQEALIHGAMLVLRAVEALWGDGERYGSCAAALARVDGPVIMTTDRADLREVDDEATLRIELPRGTPQLRAEGWRSELARRDLSPPESGIATLAATFPLSRDRIAVAVDLAASLAEERGQGVSDALLQACARTQLRSELHRYARRTQTRARLGDIVLPADVLARVTELVAAVRARPRVMTEWGFSARLSTGKGIVAMFNGPPGTGKTFTAGVIANELAMPMFRIDVSRIVDRYVGETEKNLVRLFEEASGMHALLLFDEADSLFARRTAVKDSIDRHANSQVNQLLNLIEDHEGVVVLTTNLKAGMDAAFMRRIHYKIDFALPEQAERLALWHGHVPPEVPLGDDVDFAQLAREFESSGAEVKNAVLRAALRASGHGPIRQGGLRDALIAEMEASGRVVRA